MGGAGNGIIKKFYMDEIEATRIEIKLFYDYKIICSDLGVYLYDLET